MTYREYLESTAFRLVRRQVMRRARGKCERCHAAPATEPHHLVYANWRAGEVDQPEHLVALCHACHCVVHGKDN